MGKESEGGAVSAAPELRREPWMRNDPLAHIH